MHQSSPPSATHPVSRRTALKLLGVGTVGGALGYSRLAKPQPARYQLDRLALPTQLSQPKSVVVVGAGLAGLASAYELSQRGFQVTLLEKSPNLGGKIAGWPIQVGEETFQMEHGFHGFFPQYYNLKSIVQELSISENFRSLDFYSLVFREGYAPEVFRPSHSAFPWNIVDLGISSPNRLRWGINLTKLAHLQVFRAITGFQIPKSYNQYDNISVADWVAQGFPQGLYDLYFLPFAKSSLNAPDVLSTGELLQFFHFYFFGNPEGLAFNGTKDDMVTSLVMPIVRAIEAKGGRVITEATVSEMICQDDRITSLTYQQGDAITNVPFSVTENTLLSTKSTTYYGAGDRVYLAERDGTEALSLTCSHQGCTVAKQQDGKFICPCHGAVYDEQGHVLQGPAKRNLTRFKVQKTADQSAELVALQAKTPSQQETLTADYYVLAADVIGMKHLFERVQGNVNPALVQQIQQLALADPFAVARFWFDRDFPWQHSDFASLSGYRLTDSITLYHRIQTQFIDWAQRTGGSVVELHAYCYKEKEFPTQEALLTTFEQELYEIVPELHGATVLHRELVNQKNFSGFPPASYHNRPATETPVQNLFFAGDWVKMPFPCGLMERAVSSGLLAANGVCHGEGLQRRELLTVMPEGVLQI
ncbi:FAD-dependent oxidoreductase [Synechocystis sp. LKSZ1]|uniref:FAD-dependent oxidoreductase n=1 Tax=Synechocystis sp. LKSZ1 TaxID=3144951 RepID=UPI00336BB24F